MNNKDIVSKAIYDVVKDDLTMEQVEKLLENPKSADHGDVAFPAFSLAKIYRKNGEEIIDLLKLSNRNLDQTILLITHDEKIALEADRIITIEDGKIVSDQKRR